MTEPTWAEALASLQDLPGGWVVESMAIRWPGVCTVRITRGDFSVESEDASSGVALAKAVEFARTVPLRRIPRPYMGPFDRLRR